MADLELTAKIVPMNNAFPDIVDAKNVGGDGTSANALPADTIEDAAPNLVTVIDSTGTNLKAVALGTSGHVLTSNGTSAAPTFQAVTPSGAVSMVDAPDYPDTEVVNTVSAGTLWEYTMPVGALFDPRTDIFAVTLRGVGKQNRGGASDLTLYLESTYNNWGGFQSLASGLTQFSNDATEFYWMARFWVGPHSTNAAKKRSGMKFRSTEDKNGGEIEMMGALVEDVDMIYSLLARYTFRVRATWGHASLNTYLKCRQAVVERYRTVDTPWGDVL